MATAFQGEYLEGGNICECISSGIFVRKKSITFTSCLHNRVYDTLIP